MPSHNRTGRRALALLLCLVLSLSSATLFAADAAGTSSLNSKITELEQKQAAVKSKIATLKKDISKQQELKDALQEQIENLQQQIDVYNDEISGLNKQIDALEADIAQSQADMEVTKQAFKDRLRAMYMSGDHSALTLLLSADDFGDFLYKTELMRSVTAYDSAIIDELTAAIAKLQADEQEVADKKAAVNDMKSGVVAKQNELNDSMKEMKALIANLNEQVSDLQEESAEYTAAIKKLEEEIAAAAAKAKASSTVVYDGSQFLWPVPGYYNITSGFRTARRPNHNGIDIASSGIYGKPIVAVADGRVILAGNNGNGYGIYAMIDHGNNNGNNYITLYGHMSRIACSNGQSVKAGDVIGYVGSTGRSTGPHLHYEIRVNGSPRSPLSFYNKVG